MMVMPMAVKVKPEFLLIEHKFSYICFLDKVKSNKTKTN